MQPSQVCLDYKWDFGPLDHINQVPLSSALHFTHHTFCKAPLLVPYTLLFVFFLPSYTFTVLSQVLRSFCPLHFNGCLFHCLLKHYLSRSTCSPQNFSHPLIFPSLFLFLLQTACFLNCLPDSSLKVTNVSLTKLCGLHKVDHQQMLVKYKSHRLPL